jgi:hypothetical protein
MKLLVAIPSNRPKVLAQKTLLWAPRAGFDLRIFADPTVSKKKYHNAVEEVNYQQYLTVRHNQVIYDSNPLEYAQKHGYDLLAIIPPNLRRWNNTKDSNLMVIEFQTDLADARKQIGADPSLHDVDFGNGSRVIRVVDL